MLEAKRKVSLLLAGLFLIGSPFATSSAGYLVPVPVSDASVAACVEEIGRHASYPEAGTVRHDVEVEQRRSIGHKLYISTTILEQDSDAVVRQYATVCTVVPDHAPVRFRIREVGQQ